MATTKRHRTAISRVSLSRPVALAIGDEILTPDTSFFDYGCGRGGDLRHLKALGYSAEGWDPVFRPAGPRQPADVVNFGYVANVIEDPTERVDALRQAWELATTVLIVAARLDWEARSICGKKFGDGILTGHGTFQKFFSQEGLRAWIDESLSVQSVAAAPGIFYVFRDTVREQSFLASRLRQKPVARQPSHLTNSLYEASQDVLAPLESFLLTRGRAPDLSELPESERILQRFGNLKRAVKVIQHAAESETWEAARRHASDDLLVYLALAAFGGRPKFGELPTDIQLDVKAFFRSYTRACTSADELLFAAGDQAALDRSCQGAEVGKLTPEALYVHTSALAQLPALLRVYEGCARALTGHVDEATIIKMNRIQPKISYLSYPDFDTDPHPALATSIRADLRKLDLRFRDFRASENPPVLHRKETFVSADYPGSKKFARLTAQEEKAGLFKDASAIGTRNGWLKALSQRGVRLKGHRLVRAANTE